MSTVTTPRLDLTYPTQGQNLVRSLLQRGFLLPLKAPCPVMDLLLTLPGFDRPYIEKNAQTVFINNSAADSLEQSLHPGDRLAISGPMPGLAGAIFRRSGRLGSLRARTPKRADPDRATDDCILLKLFNTHIQEKGDLLLAQGVLVNTTVLETFLTNQQNRLAAHLSGIRLDGQPLTLDRLCGAIQGLDRILVRGQVTA
jgi:hypothetical protein